MKKSMMFLAFTVMFAAFLTAPLMAQEVVDPPATWLDLFAKINIWLGSLSGVAAVTVFLAAAVNKLFKFEGFVKQLTAWIVAILLMVVGNLVNLGFMAEMNWLNTIIYGVAAGFISNGIFDITLVQLLLGALKLDVKKE